MHELEYIEKVCSKCKNRLNDKDLCHITKNLNGDHRCHNEEIERKVADTNVGE